MEIILNSRNMSRDQEITPCAYRDVPNQKRSCHRRLSARVAFYSWSMGLYLHAFLKQMNELEVTRGSLAITQATTSYDGHSSRDSDGTDEQNEGDSETSNRLTGTHVHQP